VNDRHPTVLLRGEDSDGVLTMTEDTVPAGWEGPPLHWREFDQAYYVVEGELTIQRGGRARDRERRTARVCP
jgi:mannose-6-phosphate isomerase-like protein (cupin superfamily)